ncbi:MAG: DUF5682 family protein, partial [Candidatus Eremiobacterota bacterium]
PPLVADVNAELARLRLEPARPPRSVRLDLTSQRDESAVLHRLRLLRIPGFERLSGPDWATQGQLTEEWSLGDSLDREPALIEAAGLGSNLKEAAAACLDRELALASNSAALAQLLSVALFAGLDEVAGETLRRVVLAVGTERELPVLGQALGRLYGLYRFDTLLGGHGRADLAAVLEAGFARGLWLFEGLDGPDRPADAAAVQAVAVLRDLGRLGELNLPVALAEGTMRRRMADPAAPRDCRGAALGYLWSLGLTPGEEEAVAALRALYPPEAAGDLLTGLFALAREDVLHSDSLVRALDLHLAGLDRPAFLRSLPALRLAFSLCPPREQEQLAGHIARLRGVAFLDLRLEADPTDTARGMELETEVLSLLRRYGLE